MNKDLKTLKPALVFKYFAEILEVPRPSKKEEKMIEYLMNWGESRKLETLRDEIGNVLIRKPATKGMEDRPWVCLQSHMDMVCEKNSDKVFDFEKDAIQTYIEDGWLKADGTTLGADDGIGVATQLAILDSDDIVHGPIECLFTVDEETGLTGAVELKPDFLKSRMLLNLDSEDEGEIFIGCAGGKDTLGRLPFEYEDAPEGIAFKLIIRGLKGGHSGDDINKGLGNANKILVRLLWILNEELDMRLANIDGGNLRNAIAREAEAVIMIDPEDEAVLKDIVSSFAEDIKHEFRTTEPDLFIGIESESKPDKVIDLLAHDSLISLVFALPHGVLAMSREIPGFVETSTNLASIKMVEDNIEINTSQRSSVASAIEAACAKNAACFNLAMAEYYHDDGYPGWTPNPDSKILKVAEDSYKRLFGKDPIVRAVHAGLECGLIGEKYPGMDMISFGPTIRGAHSPDERLEIDTVQMFWDHTLDILKNI